MAKRALGSREALRGAAIFSVLWLMSLAGFVTLLLEFRASNVVEIFGRTYAGVDATVAISALALGPITLLALAIRDFYRYFHAGNGE